MKYIIMAFAIVAICFFINPIFGFAVLGLGIIYAIYALVPNYYAYKGNIAFTKGDDSETLKWYEKAYATGRSNLMVRISYSFILLKMGNPEKAETILNLILLNKNVPENKRNMAKQNRAMVLYKLDRLDEAIEEAEELFENYKNTAVYGMLGYFKIISGCDLKETLDFCKEAYDYNSDDRDILDNLSIVYYKLGEYEKAKEISDKLIKSQPKFIEAFYHGAQIAEKLGNNSYAIELIENIEDCKRSFLTTVSEKEIEQFMERLKNN